MRKFISLLLCAVLFTSTVTAGFALDAEQPSSSVQNYESSVISARNGELSDLHNHTDGGEKSVKLTSYGYQSNVSISQVLLTDSQGELVIPEAGKEYVFTAYVLTEKSGGDETKFKILNTNSAFSYSAGDVVFEEKGLELIQDEWVKVSFIFSAKTLSKPYISIAMTANREASDNYTETDSYYIDDVSVIELSELYTAQIVSSPNIAGLYTDRAAHSAVYTAGGTEYSALRVYGEYSCGYNDFANLTYRDTAFTVRERGLLLADPEIQPENFVIGASGVRQGSASDEDLLKFWDYDFSSGKVRFSLLLKDISIGNKDTAFAVRPYIELGFGDESVVIYGDIQRGNGGEGISAQKAYDAATADGAKLGWYDASLVPQEISLFEGGLNSRFTVVRPSDMSNEELKATLDFYSKLNENLDVKLPIVTDSVSDSADDYEILIGNTVRNESKAAYQELQSRSGADYIIRLSGKKIVIAAENQYSLKRALNDFRTLCLTDRSTVSVSLDAGYTLAPEELKIADTGISGYTIHTDEYPSYLTAEAAKELAGFVLHKTGTVPDIINDGAKSGEKLIIISGGDNAGLEENQYLITLENGNLKVDGGSSASVNAGVKALIEDFESDGAVTEGSGGFYDGEEYSLADGYALAWNDEFDGEKTDTSKWTSMSDTTAGPHYRISDEYYLTSSASQNSDERNSWLTGRYIAAFFEDNSVSVDYDDSKADAGRVGDNYIFFDNIDEEYVSALENAVKSSGGQIVLSDIVSSGYAQEGLQTRPAKEGEGGTYYLKDGYLHEITRKTSSGYDAVRLYTGGRMSYRYGMTEVRMIMATNNGACSSFWLSGSGNEIDVYENYGKDSFYANLHTWEPYHINHISAGNMQRVVVEPDEGEHFYDTFHHIGFEWTDSYIAFYLDGEIYQIVDITDEVFEVFRRNISVKLANGVGTGTYSLNYNPGNFLGVDTKDFCEEQVIDYIRIYQRNDSLSRLES